MMKVGVYFALKEITQFSVYVFLHRTLLSTNGCQDSWETKNFPLIQVSIAQAASEFVQVEGIR